MAGIGVAERLRTGINVIPNTISRRLGGDGEPPVRLRVPTSPLIIAGPFHIGRTTIEAPPGKLDEVIKHSREREQGTTWVTVFPGVQVRRRMA